MIGLLAGEPDGGADFDKAATVACADAKSNVRKAAEAFGKQ